MSDHVYQRKNGKWEARYRKGKYKNGKTRYGSVFGDTREEAIARRDSLIGYDPENPFGSSEMNVLILGAGSYGREVRKALEQLRVFNKIYFLDDSLTGGEIRGKCEDVVAFKGAYPCAFVAIADTTEYRRIK